ncbi:hypothetical protein ES288_D02G164300v1 [Gossypium darwinii]|uniref:Small ribosomal subunit protein uS7 domain-containing protein n=1 Tax=Gossypium darwinii TaxID=34276 RepID=A0A5D2DD96_GOSDA|nr:hypothetical protein ES288_D02G164300v1 [Gossypium darwinii]
MSRRSTAEEKTTKFDPIYRNRLVNMLTETNPLYVLRQALCGVTLNIAVKARSLAIRWLLGASRKRLGRNMAFKLCFKLVDAANGSGDAIRKMEETHRMAEANRAFAHFH